MQNYVHGLSEFFQAGRAAGLQLTEFKDRYVTSEWVSATGSYQAYLGWPITYLLAFVTSPPGAG